MRALFPNRRWEKKLLISRRLLRVAELRVKWSAPQQTRRQRTLFFSVTLCQHSLSYFPISSYFNSLFTIVISTTTSSFQKCQPPQTTHPLFTTCSLDSIKDKGRHPQACLLMLMVYYTVKINMTVMLGMISNSTEFEGKPCTCCSSGDRNAPFKRSRAAEGSTNLRFDPIIRANKY